MRDTWGRSRVARTKHAHGRWAVRPRPRAGRGCVEDVEMGLLKVHLFLISRAAFGALERATHWTGLHVAQTIGIVHALCVLEEFGPFGVSKY